MHAVLGDTEALKSAVGYIVCLPSPQEKPSEFCTPLRLLKLRETMYEVYNGSRPQKTLKKGLRRFKYFLPSSKPKLLNNSTSSVVT